MLSKRCATSAKRSGNCSSAPATNRMACQSRCEIRVQASRRRLLSACSRLSTRRSLAVWGWACRSVVRSSKRTAADCGRARTCPAAPHLNSPCLPIQTLHRDWCLGAAASRPLCLRERRKSRHPVRSAPEALRAVAQDLGVSGSAKSFWLGELENVSVGLGVSLLQWRSGGFEHPHDTPSYPLMPSPTFAHSSSLVGWLTNEASHGASGPFIANTHADDSPVRHCSSVRSNRNRVGFLRAATFRGHFDAVPVRSRRDRLVRRNRARCARNCPLSPQP